MAPGGYTTECQMCHRRGQDALLVTWCSSAAEHPLLLIDWSQVKPVLVRGLLTALAGDSCVPLLAHILVIVRLTELGLHSNCLMAEGGGGGGGGGGCCEV